MIRSALIVIGILGLFTLIQTKHVIAHETGKKENVPVEDIYLHETGEVTGDHHGLTRNLRFSNFHEGWLTPWETYEENADTAPRVPLLRIAPAFFKREVRFNYLYIDDEHDGEADVSEWGLVLELPLTLRFKIDIESKVLHVNTMEDTNHVGFGDTRFALRTMLLKTEKLSLSTGSVFNIPTGDEDRHLGEGITTAGQQLAFWADMGHRMGLHVLAGVDVSTGGNHNEDESADFLYGTALSKTFTIKETSLLEGITPFVECNGHKGFGLDEEEHYRVDLLPGVRWDISHELYVMQGIEIPLNGTGEFDKRVWFSIIKDF